MKKTILLTIIALFATIVAFGQIKNALITNFGYTKTASNYDTAFYSPSNNPLYSLSIQYKYNFFKRFFIVPEIFFARKTNSFQTIDRPDIIHSNEDIFNFTYSLNLGFDIIKTKKIELSTSVGFGRQTHDWKYIYYDDGTLPEKFKNKTMTFYSYGYSANITGKYIFNNNSFVGLGYDFKNYEGLHLNTFLLTFGAKF